jgi:hypothetical protein
MEEYLMIKKVIMSLVLVASAFHAQAADTAAVKPKQAPHKTIMPLPDMIAIAMANTLNRLGNVENFTKWISLRVPEDEMSKLKANFPKMGLTPKVAFPTITAKGNKVYFDKDTYFTISKKMITMNGKSFKTSDQTYDVLVHDIYTALVKGKTASYSIFLPEAHALSQQATYGLVGMALGGALGYFVGPKLGVDNATGAIAGASVLGLGGLFLGSEDSSWVTGLLGNNSSSNISCYRGGAYQVCNKTGGSYFGNNSQCQIMSAQSAAQYGTLPACAPANSQAYYQTYQNIGNRPYYPTRTGPPAGSTLVVPAVQ